MLQAIITHLCYMTDLNTLALSAAQRFSPNTSAIHWRQRQTLWFI